MPKQSKTYILNVHYLQSGKDEHTDAAFYNKNYQELRYSLETRKYTITTQSPRKQHFHLPVHLIIIPVTFQIDTTTSCKILSLCTLNILGTHLQMSVTFSIHPCGNTCPLRYPSRASMPKEPNKRTTDLSNTTG